MTLSAYKSGSENALSEAVISYPFSIGGGGLVTKSCLAVCHPVDCSLPGSSVHRDYPSKNTGVHCHFRFQGSSLARDQICVSWIAGQLFNKLIPTQQFKTLKKKQTFLSVSSWRSDIGQNLFGFVTQGYRRLRRKCLLGCFFTSILTREGYFCRLPQIVGKIHFPVFVGVNILLAGFQMEAFLSLLRRNTQLFAVWPHEIAACSLKTRESNSVF